MWGEDGGSVLVLFLMILQICCFFFYSLAFPPTVSRGEGGLMR